MGPEAWQILRPWEPGAQERLEGLLDGDGTRPHLRRVEADAGREVARFVSLQLELRRRARARFPDGRLQVLTSKGLEQATAARIADLRAERIGEECRTSSPWLWDACCGIGSDALAAARAGARVLAMDSDPGSLRCAAFQLGASGSAILGDALRPPLGLNQEVMVLVDPDRRSADRRLRDPESWSPTLSQSLELARAAGLGCIKLPPGLDPRAAGLEGRSDVVLEWVSLDGELRELTAWVGPWSWLEGRGKQRVVALRGDDGRAECELLKPTAPPPPAPIEIGLSLFEWDPGMLLSNLAQQEGCRIGLRPVEGAAGFWVGPKGTETPLARSWTVLEVLPLDRKRVRAMLRQRNIGPLTIKTRGIRESSEALAQRLGTRGQHPGLLAVTRTEGGAVVALLEPNS